MENNVSVWDALRKSRQNLPLNPSTKLLRKEPRDTFGVSRAINCFQAKVLPNFMKKARILANKK